MQPGAFYAPPPGMMVVSTNYVPVFRIVRTIGFTWGLIVRARGIGQTPRVRLSACVVASPRSGPCCPQRHHAARTASAKTRSASRQTRSSLVPSRPRAAGGVRGTLWCRSTRGSIRARVLSGRRLSEPEFNPGDFYPDEPMPDESPDDEPPDESRDEESPDEQPPDDNPS